MNEFEHIIIIGAQRSGTTLLYGMLDDHPEIEMSRPVRPEPKYFLDSSERFDYKHYISKVFPETNGLTKYLGEKSTSYYERPEVVKRIYKVVPTAKIIIQFRDPIDRALSNFDFSHEHGLESRTLEEAFLNGVPSPQIDVQTSVDPFDYLGRGEYVRHLYPFLEKFRNQMLLLDTQRVIDGKENLTICKFLGVSEHNFSVDLNLFRNEVPRTEAGGEVLQKLSEYYKPWNLELQEVTGFDVSTWK
ncbi:MAG: sulfotransferase [Flavobacteriales bacterium]|nr:sulfotransferase [Flavobacteriales bacterium]